MKETNAQIKSGIILIAEPFSEDEYFEQTVCLLTEHEMEQGTMGFILNRPASFKLSEIVEEVDTDFEGYVYFGGPVSMNTLHFLHTAGDLIEDSLEIAKGIYWGGSFEQVKFLINTGVIKPNQIRFYLGYSGWEPGQLHQEMSDGSWITTYADVNYVFQIPAADLWKMTMKNKSEKHAILAEVPEHINYN